MARKHEAVELLMSGMSPTQIARQMGINVASVMGYLYNQVGEGRIRRSDILFGYDEQTRASIESVISPQGSTHWFDVYRTLESSGKTMAKEDVRIYVALRDVRVALGDMYELIRDIEVTVHKAIKRMLIQEFGENDWWRRGAPENIRAECAAARERDPAPSDEPYCYTTLINLKEILKSNWGKAIKYLPEEVSRNRGALLDGIGKLNTIRNSVMHPVRGTPPTHEDSGFVRGLSDFLQLSTWRTKQA